MGWVRYFEEKNARAQRADSSGPIAQTEEQIKAVLANIDRRHASIQERQRALDVARRG